MLVNPDTLRFVVFHKLAHVLLLQIDESAADAAGKFDPDIAAAQLIKELVASLHLVGDALRGPRASPSARE
jgi:hypothetical protein